MELLTPVLKKFILYNIFYLEQMRILKLLSF